jgi:hypothetical protein
MAFHVGQPFPDPLQLLDHLFPGLLTEVEFVFQLGSGGVDRPHLKLPRPRLEHFKDERNPGETFGDYCQRLGVEHARALLPRVVVGD